MSRKEKIIFCIDDAQWADEATLATIAYLIERPPFDQNLIILLGRLEDQADALRKHLDQFKKSRFVNIIRLPYLDRHEISELLSVVTGNKYGLKMVSQLAQASGGNPLYLVEILRTLQEKQISPEGFIDQEFPITSSLKSLILSRLEAITPQSIETLQTAAILGVEFEPRILALANRKELPEIIPTLEELERNQLVEVLPSFPGKVYYRFIHSAIREVLLNEISPLRRQWLERMVAISIESCQPLGDGRQAAVIAEHFEKGGDGVRAFEKWVLAGQYARTLFSLKEAELAFRRAENLIPILPELPESHIYELFTNWAEMVHEIEDAEATEQLSQRLEKIGNQRGNPLILGTALNIKCQVCLIRNNHETGLQFAEKAIQFLEECGFIAAHIEALSHKGVFLYMQGKFDLALPPFLQAINLGNQIIDGTALRARANVHYQLAFVYAMTGRPNLAIQHAYQSLEDYIQVKRSYGQAYAYSALTLAYFISGKLGLALQHCLDGFEIAERTHAIRIQGYLHGYNAMIDFEHGNLDSAYHHAEKCIQIGQQLQHTEISSLGYRILGDIHSVIWDNEGITAFQSALNTSPSGFMYVDAVSRQGLMNYLSGNKPEGIAQLYQAIELARATGLESFFFLAETARLTILFREDELDQAIQLGHKLQEEGLQRGLKSIQLFSAWILGCALLKSGETQAAITCLTNVVDESSKKPYIWLELTALVDLNKALVKDGRPDTTIREKVAAILEQIDERTQHPNLKNAYQTYKSAILNLMI